MLSDEFKRILSKYKSNNRIIKRLEEIGIKITKNDIREYLLIISEDGHVKQIYPNILDKTDYHIVNKWFDNGKYGSIDDNLYSLELSHGTFIFEMYPYYKKYFSLIGCILRTDPIGKAKLIYTNSLFINQRVLNLGW